MSWSTLSIGNRPRACTCHLAVQYWDYYPGTLSISSPGLGSTPELELELGSTPTLELELELELELKPPEFEFEFELIFWKFAGVDPNPD